MSKREKFIENYETKVKYARKQYYKSVINEGLTSTSTSISYYLINFIPLILAILISLIGNFSYITLIISVIALIALSILISITRKICYRRRWLLQRCLTKTNK